MRYFLDNNLAPRYARALNELEGPDGNTVVHLKDKFDQADAGRGLDGIGPQVQRNLTVKRHGLLEATKYTLSLADFGCGLRCPPCG